MVYPTKYTRQFDFASYQNSNPTRPLPGDKVNIDYDRVKQSVNEIIDFLRGFSRSDGKLANNSVGIQQLDPSVRIGFSLPTTWEPNVEYLTGATVFYANRFYLLKEPHVSSDGLDESKWEMIVDFGAEADAAAASAVAAAASASSANGSATQTGLDRAATGADRTQTGLDAANAAESASVAGSSALDAAGSADAASASAASAADNAAQVEALATAIGHALVNAESIGAVELTNVPPVVNYLRVSSFAVPGDGGGAMYKRVLMEPSHAGKVQSADGAWWEIADLVLNPEMFGSAGVNASNDTNAWVKLVSVANARGGNIRIRLEKNLRLLGTGVGVDSQTFTNFTSLWIEGRGVEVYQHSSLSKTFKFIKAGGKAKVTDVEFVGYAEQQINASATPNEINFNASSGNAVAAIYAEDLQELYCARVKTRNHAGRDIDCRGVLHVKGRDLDLVGLGPTYNRPAIDGHQGNGEDAAIYHIPKVSVVSDPIHGSYYDPPTTTAWRQTLDICNSRIKWHSFGIRTILNAAIILHGNYFGTTPGQHCVYDSDSDGHDIVGNVFEEARQSGYKMQYENLAGVNYGKIWLAATPYVVGDVVRSFGIAWVCKTAHTSGGSFSSTNWDSFQRNNRIGGVWTGNQFKNCGTGIGIIESSNVDGRNNWSEGYVISGNFFLNCTDGAMYLDRLWKASVNNNNVQGGLYGIFGKNFCGTISGNEFWTQGLNSVAVSLSKTTTIKSNKFANYGQGVTATTDDKRVAVLVFAPNVSTQPPARSNNPRLHYRDNGHVHMVIGDAAEAADAPGAWLTFVADSRIQCEVEETWGTPTTKLFRVDGTLDYKFRNHFPGYFNTAQNEPAFTLDYSADFVLEAASTLSGVRDVLGTYIAQTQGKRIVK